MRRPDRITRSYWLGIPRWRTTDEQQIDGRVFRLYDFLLLALTLLTGLSVLIWVAAIWYFFLFPVVIGRRLYRLSGGDSWPEDPPQAYYSDRR